VARRTAPKMPAPPTAPKKVLTVREMERGIERLDARLKELSDFDVNQMTTGHPPEIAALSAAIQGTLERLFGENTSEYKRFSPASILEWESGVVIGNYPQLQHYKKGTKENFARAIALLVEAKRVVVEELEEASQTVEPAAVSDRSKVFVVHGHDEGAREALARFIQAIGFEPVILHERANAGRTVIEKVEAHGDVGFAVVLLTPDDEGCEKGGTPGPRARQNVVLELGYFIGHLGRGRVCALKRGELEIPSDFGGVVYEPFDASGGWKQKLGRELEVAGYEIDWNTVMRS
jgi:predicted nucleotide-binding protein